jgi:RES domain-containing protein
VFRHMFASYPPDRENTVGARWNPPGVPAIYTSLSREGVLAEADYQISMEPLRPRARRTVYQVRLVLHSVLDLSTVEALRRVGLNLSDVGALDYSKCAAVGGAAEHLGHDGLLVPSARFDAINLVIFPNRQTPDYLFEVDDQEVVFEPDR